MRRPLFCDPLAGLWTRDFVDVGEHRDRVAAFAAAEADPGGRLQVHVGARVLVPEVVRWVRARETRFLHLDRDILHLEHLKERRDIDAVQIKADAHVMNGFEPVRSAISRKGFRSRRCAFV